MRLLLEALELAAEDDAELLPVAPRVPRVDAVDLLARAAVQRHDALELRALDVAVDEAVQLDRVDLEAAFGRLRLRPARLLRLRAGAFEQRADVVALLQRQVAGMAGLAVAEQVGRRATAPPAAGRAP